MERLDVRDVHFRYNGQPVLAGASLAIERGEQVALLGPNGVGKTTLLKLIAGVLTPKAGSVFLDGDSVRRIPRNRLARKIAVVPQDFIVPFAFTAKEIVELGRTPHLRGPADVSAIHRGVVEDAMTVTHTAELAHRIFNELSGGERRRVIIAMALAQEPEVLLLDEPTQQLDIARQVEVLDLISALNDKQRLTVIAAIHDLNLACRYFGRLIFLHQGSIAADGNPHEVMHSDLMQRVYGANVEVLRDDTLDGTPIVVPRGSGIFHVQKQAHEKGDGHANPVATS